MPFYVKKMAIKPTVKVLFLICGLMTDQPPAPPDNQFTVTATYKI